MDSKSTKNNDGYYPILDLSQFFPLVVFLTFFGVTIIMGYFGNTAFFMGLFKGFKKS